MVVIAGQRRQAERDGGVMHAAAPHVDDLRRLCAADQRPQILRRDGKARSQHEPPPVPEEAVLGREPWKCGATAAGPTRDTVSHVACAHNAQTLVHPSPTMHGYRTLCRARGNDTDLPAP